MLEAGARIPDATVFARPREPMGLRELARERPFVLVFYLFDWSST